MKQKNLAILIHLAMRLDCLFYTNILVVLCQLPQLSISLRKPRYLNTREIVRPKHILFDQYLISLTTLFMKFIIKP